jgi:hypothetical protein
MFVAAAAALSVAAVAIPTVVMSAGPASASAAGAQFTADRASLSTASKAFITAFNAWQNKGGSASAAAPFVGTYVTALVAQDHKLLGQSWPAGALADIDAVVRGDAAAEGVVEALLDQTSASISSWYVSYDQAAATGVADANIVRRDLGIPLATTA